MQSLRTGVFLSRPIKGVPHLTCCPETLPLELHSLYAFEGNHGVQGCAASFEPTVGQESGRAAVDFLALRVGAAPTLVLAARPCRIAHNHEAVLALVGDDRLVGDGCEHGLPVDWAVGDWALHGHTRGQLRWGPRAVALAVACVLAHQLEPRYALVSDLHKSGPRGIEALAVYDMPSRSRTLSFTID